MGTYRISQLAEWAGVAATTLRFYEKVGLLPAQRTAVGYRIYSDTDAERLRFIAAAKHLGLPLDQIRELLGVWEGGLCREVRDRLRPLLLAQIDTAQDRMADLDMFIRRLTTALTHLDQLPAKDRPCDPDCEFLHDRGSHPARPAADAAVTQPARQSGEPTPVACSLPTDEYRSRIQRWHTMLDGASREALPDGGMRVRLPITRAAQLAELVVAEQQCCPFFTFRLTLANEYVELDVHAPAAAQPLVADLVRAQAGSC